MTQDELWLRMYQEVKTIITTNKRNQSKHRVEEHLMLNWVKHNCKLFIAGIMNPEQEVMFVELVDLCEDSMRKNQC